MLSKDVCFNIDSVGQRCLDEVCDFRGILALLSKNKNFAEDIWDRVPMLEGGGYVSRGCDAESVVYASGAKEFLLRLYRDAHNDYFIQPNIGRYLFFQRLCLLELSHHYWHNQVAESVSSELTIPLPEIRVSKLNDPLLKFTASPRLVTLVKNHMVKPDEMAVEILKQMRKMRPDADSQKQEIETIVSVEVENFLTDLAKRFSISGEPPLITSDQRFSPETCSEIIDRLELDAYNPTPVLDLLYKELTEFLSRSREREWGKIIFKDSKFTFLLRDDAFKIPVISSINEDLWVSL
jgi:hypothetical protein